MKTYKTWILQYIKEDSPRGDLAIDIKDDKKFPATKSKEKIITYLEFKGACDGAISAFECSYREYVKEGGKE
jgi:uncharacterized protein YozE (UPF0346 family)